MRQTHFQFANAPKEILTHGGSPKAKKRKGPRPLCTKRPLHMVMKCNKQIFAHRQVIIDTLITYSQTFNMPIYSFAIGHDHVHFVTKVPSRSAYVKFIRAVTGLLGKTLGVKLFAAIPFTRIATWGRDFRNLLQYMQQNWEEVWGVTPYKPRWNAKKPKPS